MDHTSDTIRWIPLLPLLAAALLGAWLLFARGQLPRHIVIVLGCGAPIASFVLAFRSFFELTQLAEGSRFLVDDVYTWISVHPFHAQLSFLFDPLSAVMVLVVTGVGSLIHIYSVGYMDDDRRDDRGFQRFFLYLNLFTFSMLMLVLGDNLLVMFVGWEGVGLCSYLLIGFWYLEDHNAMCGQKAFVVNRIGDFGFLIGIFLLFWAFYQAGYPSIEFREMAASVGTLAERTVALPAWLSWLPGFPTWKLLTLAGLCLFVGACGKSAQIPLYVWLPDAMAGPTPVSALIHAATMVTAGVYMICRMSFVYSLAPGALATIAWVGGLTALFAGTIGICQKDIKKVLAYSTVSQLGYMFLAVGVAAYSAAIFHLVTHAFFKALLFLAAGSVILGVHHEQDIDRMGGLARRMPWTFATFLVGVLAIAGAPPFSGFFSKDEILLSVYAAHVPGHVALWGIGVFSAGLTAFYMFRLHYLVFAGETRVPGGAGSVREPSSWVVYPLVVLAALAAIGGVIGMPDMYGELLGVPNSNSLYYFLQGVAPSPPHDVGYGTELGLMSAAVASAALGVLLATYLYWLRPDVLPRWTARIRPLYQLLYNKYFVDEFYDRAIVQPLVWVSNVVLFRWVDTRVIDGLGVNGAARVVYDLADRGIKFAQTGFTQSYVFVMLIGAVCIVAWLVAGV